MVVSHGLGLRIRAGVHSRHTSHKDFIQYVIPGSSICTALHQRSTNSRCISVEACAETDHLMTFDCIFCFISASEGSRVRNLNPTTA